MSHPITMLPWIGSNLHARKKRILILGESWYGPPANLGTYIPDWCAKIQQDYLFSRVFNAASGCLTATANVAQRQAFWDSVIFDNFVNWPVGTSRSARPTAAHYSRAAAAFPARLSCLNPDAVWVLGLGQASYSIPLLGDIHHVASPHPCGWGVKTATLTAAWNRL
jgi:hypothetical protein